MDSLIAYLNSIDPLSTQLVNHLAAVIKSKHINKREYIVKKGRICEHIWFVKSGLVRRFDTDGNSEFTSCLMQENDIVYSVGSLCEQLPANEHIQAVCPAELLYISYADLRELLALYPGFYHTYGKICQQCLRRSEQHKYILQMNPAEDRLKYMRINHPALVSRIPDKILASYLGYRAEHLSRIKAKTY
jgi:CRP-like cAMP-binding protein